MKSIDLLEKYPESFRIIKEWFTNQLIASMKEDTTTPKEFMEAVLEEGFSKARLAVMIDANPRILFDCLDENEIYVVMGVIDGKDSKPLFHFHLHGINDGKDVFESRKEAEFQAIELAFEVLNDQKIELTTINKEIEDETK